MWTWDQITKQEHNKTYPRTPDDESEYQFHKRIACEFFGSIENYIQVINVDPLESYRLVKNRFTYNVATGIRHYLLWIKPGFYITELSIEKLLKDRFPDSEIMFYQNKVQHRSILTVEHYQVFVKSDAY
jgi:hypothetical protein